MVVRSLLALFTLVVVFISVVLASESAWNGHTTPGSTQPTRFTPYYVAPGTKSYDSNSPIIHYSAHWKEVFSSAYIHKSVRSTTRKGAQMTFRFTGTGVEWFGSTGSRHGVAKVYLDGQLVDSVDTWSSVARQQQRLYWNFNLPFGKHTLKIVNAGQRQHRSKGSKIDVDAVVVTLGAKPSVASSAQSDDVAPIQNDAVSPQGGLYNMNLATLNPTETWTLTRKGNTGVHAMQLAVISDSHAIIVDKVEHNPLSIDGHPAWAALYNLDTHAVKPLRMQSNSFCAGGTFLSNGTLINVGGNPVVEDHTSAADFGDVDGLQAVRIFEPCDSDNVDDCEMFEDHSRVRMASPRWYNTVLRISDGSAMIIGGSLKGGWINNATTNNPTVEYYPPKDIQGSNGMPVKLQFLVDTLNSNLFPIAFSLPDGKVFVAANQDAMIYDWQTNTERRLPQIPNGVRVTYPMTGTGLLLPLTPENNYTPEVLLCGGSTVDDTKPGYEISSQDPASAQCSRMVLTEDGIAAGWQVEQMPAARTMPDAVILPTGKILIVNGAGSGISGYANVVNQVGASNADHPVFTPVLYDPAAPAGARFSAAGLPTSSIPRLYHSVATVVPSGSVMIAGSNPNLDRSEVKYGTEYRVEWLDPPYMGADRPTLGNVPQKIDFKQTVQFNVKLPSAGAGNVKVVLMDFGYVTHAVHANSRYVELVSSRDGDVVTVNGPPDGNIYPPGPGWLFVVADGIPSKGVKVMIGDGQGPEVNEAAIANVLANTSADQYDVDKKEKLFSDDSE
ncbi:copper radical oxidase [Phanerochaete sordida]|uniref:Copper radical oxidase n=1 Tax=Phanerochaete sordida TaxID=48140 RepID=A0A9P3GAB5_9APHY|nr:copper radical oxidase [Phanerochaete sordida]